MKHVYLLSGLGADERVFRYLQFPAGYTLHYLPWLTPVAGETFAAYATRMAAHIQHEQCLLLGVSFGGMVSLEIARQRPVEKIILISSIKHTREKPPYFNWIRRTGLHRLPDGLLYRHRHAVVKYFLHTETEEERQLLREYLRKKDYGYLRWAVNAVLHWENDQVPAGLVHIHGGRDLTFPVRFVKPDYTIADGGHFMVLNRAREINSILGATLG